LVSFKAFCAKAQKSNQFMGFGSLLVLRFSLFLSAKRLSFACGLPTTIQQQRRIPSLVTLYTRWQIERKAEKRAFGFGFVFGFLASFWFQVPICTGFSRQKTVSLTTM